MAAGDQGRQAPQAPPSEPHHDLVGRKTLAACVINRGRVRDVGELRRSCRAAAAGAGWDVVLLETAPEDSGLAGARRGVEAGAQLIVAAGGDGTVRACAEAVCGTDIPLGIVPLGTANLAARAVGLPTNPVPALAIAFAGAERQIDVGVAGGMSFLAMAGIGLDAEVVAATPGVLKGRLGWLGYAASGLPRLWGRPTTFHIRLDGRPGLRLGGSRELVRRARAVVVGNAGLLPGGFTLLPSARLDDAVLDVGILAPEDLIGWARVGLRVLAGSSRSDRLLERHQARSVEITADRDLPWEVDGEVRTPGHSLDVAVRPRALIIRVPRTHVR